MGRDSSTADDRTGTIIADSGTAPDPRREPEFLVPAGPRAARMTRARLVWGGAAGLLLVSPLGVIDVPVASARDGSADAAIWTQSASIEQVAAGGYLGLATASTDTRTRLARAYRAIDHAMAIGYANARLGGPPVAVSPLSTDQCERFVARFVF
jgi:hypothetical protein